jgi:AraC family transcriptional regulator
MHRVSMHLSAPITATCHSDGPPVRNVIGPGTLDIVPLGYPVTWLDEGPARIISVGLHPSIMRSAAEEMRVNLDTLHFSPQLHASDPILEHLSWAMVAELENRDHHDRLFAESIGNAMATHLLRRYAVLKLPRYEPSLSRKQLDAVVDYINTNIAADLSLSELACVAGVSASYFTVLFRRAIGISVHQYVMRCRVDHAMRLLSRGSVRLCEVAQEAGFTDQSHMARCMRRLTGTTPAAFARQFQREVG